MKLISHKGVYLEPHISEWPEEALKQLEKGLKKVFKEYREPSGIKTHYSYCFGSEIKARFIKGKILKIIYLTCQNSSTAGMGWTNGKIVYAYNLELGIETTQFEIERAKRRARNKRLAELKEKYNLTVQEAEAFLKSDAPWKYERVEYLRDWLDVDIPNSVWQKLAEARSHRYFEKIANEWDLRNRLSNAEELLDRTLPRKTAIAQLIFDIKKEINPEKGFYYKRATFKLGDILKQVLK